MANKLKNMPKVTAIFFTWLEHRTLLILSPHICEIIGALTVKADPHSHYIASNSMIVELLCTEHSVLIHLPKEELHLDKVFSTPSPYAYLCYSPCKRCLRVDEVTLDEVTKLFCRPGGHTQGRWPCHTSQLRHKHWFLHGDNYLLMILCYAITRQLWMQKRILDVG